MARKKHAHTHARPPSAMVGEGSLLLDTVGAEKLTGFSTHVFRTWRRTGRGPTIIQVGRTVRYRRSDLEKFVEEHAISPVDFVAATRRKATAPSTTTSTGGAR